MKTRWETQSKFRKINFTWVSHGGKNLSLQRNRKELNFTLKIKMYFLQLFHLIFLDHQIYFLINP